MSTAKPAKIQTNAVTINVLGREFRVAAPEGEERHLLASVDLVNRKMKEIRDTGKVVGNERIAIMAALNLAHEQLQAPTKNAPLISKTANITVDQDYVKGKLQAFEITLEKAISEQEKLF